MEELQQHARSLDPSKPLAVDLFSGAGGLSLGLHSAGFEVVLACDIRPDSIATHRHHFAGCSHQCDLSSPEVLKNISRMLNGCGDIALVAGGPPCQPFSRNIRWRKHDAGFVDQHRQLNEGRRELWESFLTVVEEVMPRTFLMENVPDIAQTGDQEVFRGIVSRAEKAGYRVHARIIHAWEYGVPQLRSRLFIAGTRIGYSAPLQWPNPVCSSVEQAVPLEDAISDLPPLIGDWWEQWAEQGDYAGPQTQYQELMRNWLPLTEVEIPDHITRKVRGDDLETFQLMRETGLRYHELDDEQRRYSVTRKSPPTSINTDTREHSFRNKYNILKPNEPCLTVTAHMSKDGYWYIHPKQNRTLSIREAARVQSFPDGFLFHGTPSNRFHQVGEAVAPLVGAALGGALLEALLDGEPHEEWSDPKAVREELLRWYREEGGDSLLPWARQRENGDDISDSLKAWRAFLGEFLVSRLPLQRQQTFWPQLITCWPDHEVFLNDLNRRRTLRSFSFEGLENLLEGVAIQLKDELPWSQWVRNDSLAGVGRDRIRQCLAMVGITADRSCNTALGRLVARVSNLQELECEKSRQLRELNLGLMLGGDEDGKIYRAAVAVADGWCHQVPQCDGKPGASSYMCPLNASNLCKGKGHK
ncbi:DNA cytosine methyltransferase [Synechococcus lacustris]|uniref:DNA cytosine methyltransferase n=1 Tax=Synechococcus lacustris TaxID=2116544 RepID=UPI001F4F0BA7|nr:DNA cytosine methyltransferase [Synechococcus lacustris]